MSRLIPLALAAALAACGPADDAAVAPAGEIEAVGGAVADCASGDPAAGLAALADDAGADALVARGLCRWALWAETDDPDDARRAYDDLTAAIDLVEDGGPTLTPLDEIYAHRAFVAHALDGVWVRTIEDLGVAAALDPDEPRHALDLGVVRAYAGDTVRARAALDAYLVLADSAGVPEGDASRAVVEALRSDLATGE